MEVASTKDVMKLFKCGQTAAKKKIKEVRQELGKTTCNGNGKRGADPVTIEQIIEHFKLK